MRKENIKLTPPAANSSAKIFTYKKYTMTNLPAAKTVS
ncbi:hypothetical protein SBF1_2240009 [Candidatus Desulfosporosinus infrequens]|uniref:Uncharacterized protein n=1 Tax=Candidatus Desulfosporosinus infrequens TaxID=2043169 RepID=A0A2U3KLW7_9FIRM|nr:hypothetical protein SBF1_2240009 [Candidatus Desulfosporosinus infrequens]